MRFLSLFAALMLTASFGARAATPRAAAPGSHALDFWLGEWEVFDRVSGERLGSNFIESVLQGSAVIEHWREPDGHLGMSWFYFYRPENRWKQVWVTDDGFVKEKACIELLPGGGTRFRGEIKLPDGRLVQDQTTLTPLPDGTVRQVIEQSLDGKKWKTGFDAIYRRRVAK